MKTPNNITQWLWLSALIIAVPTLCCIGLYTSEADMLYRAQELSLFLPTHLFYDPHAVHPGGTLTWMACFFTQMFYYPALGTSLLGILWALIIALLCGNNRLRGPWTLMSGATVLMLLACIVQTGYWLYYQKLPGHIMVPTLGTLLSLVGVGVYRLLPHRYGIHLAWMLLWGIAAYPLLGAWSFIATGLMMMPATLRRQGWLQEMLLPMVLGIALVGAVPYAYYYVYDQTQLQQMWVAGMPCFRNASQSFEEYRYPYYALALALALPSIIRWVPQQRLHWAASLVVSLATLVAFAWEANSVWYHDSNFHKEIQMNRAIEDQDWDRVLTISLAPSDSAPTRVVVMDKNLALFRLGRAGDEMFHFPEGAALQNAPWQVRLTQVGGKQLYYQYGKENFAYRWCMEDGVEFGWSVDLLRLMTKACLVQGEWVVAEKYLDMLDQTLFHREWAAHYRRFVRHPELMEQDPEFRMIMPMSQYPDRLDGDMTLVEMYLLKTFSSGNGADPYYQENTLLCAMIMKDIDLFWPRFLQYINMHQHEEGFHVPLHYQEAAYLYSMLEPQRQSVMWPELTNGEAVTRLPFDAEVKQSYEAFMNFNTQCGAMTDEQKAKAFYPQFSNTFYYFYFLRRNQKTN